MVDFIYGQIAIGGPVGFIEVINPDGSFVRRIVQNDDLGSPMWVNGISFTAEGEMLSVVSVEDNAVDYAPHDIVVLPDQSGYLVIVSRPNNTATLRKYNMEGDIEDSWSIAVDDGWTANKTMRIDVACDSRTVYYTDQGRTVFKYDIGTTNGTQLTNHLQLPEESPYIYAAFKLLTNGNIIIDASSSGTGPQQALCLDSSLTKIWTDEINPTGDYHVIQRNIASPGAEVARYVTRLDAENNDHEVTALGCYIYICMNPGVARYSSSSLTRQWFTETN